MLSEEGQPVVYGLQAGEKVMVDGFQKARPGQQVKPVALQPGGREALAAAPARPRP